MNAGFETAAPSLTPEWRLLMRERFKHNAALLRGVPT